VTTLVCALVGVQGNAFAVDVDENKFVDHLKDAIKTKNENTIMCDARELQLFLARKGDNTWLESSTEDVKKLKKGEKTDLIEALTREENALDGECGLEEVLDGMPRLKTKQIHVLVVVPQQEQVQVQPSLWLVSGSVENALNTKGVRSRLYRLAGSYLGCYDPEHRIGDQIQALWYDGTALRVHVLFTESMYLIAFESWCEFGVLLLYEGRDALLFENALQEERMTPVSPLNGQVLTVKVSTVSRDAGGLQRIFTGDYAPQETESPQDTMSFLSATTSVVDVLTDEFKYQRIENETWFGPLGKAQSCHLMSREHCRKYATYHKYDNDKSNRLALSAEMHGWYDALTVSVPVMNIRVESVSSGPALNDRFEVSVWIRAIWVGLC
jgi:hypothetical protein